MKGLTRIDTTGHHGFHGWEARTVWKFKELRKKFSDSKHGGRERAMLHAAGWLAGATRSQDKLVTPKWIRSTGANYRKGRQR